MLVRIERSIEDRWEDGYVLDLGANLVLSRRRRPRHPVRRLSGLPARRHCETGRPSSSRRLCRVSTLAPRSRTPPTPSVNLESIPELLRSASSSFSLLTIHTEDEDPEVCWIGQFLETNEDHVTFRGITPDASWDELPDSYPIDEITRIDFGGAYEEALLAGCLRRESLGLIPRPWT